MFNRDKMNTYCDKGFKFDQILFDSTIKYNEDERIAIKSTELFGTPLF